MEDQGKDVLESADSDFHSAANVQARPRRRQFVDDQAVVRRQSVRLGIVADEADFPTVVTRDELAA